VGNTALYLAEHFPNRCAMLYLCFKHTCRHSQCQHRATAGAVSKQHGYWRSGSIADGGRDFCTAHCCGLLLRSANKCTKDLFLLTPTQVNSRSNCSYAEVTSQLNAIDCIDM